MSSIKTGQVVSYKEYREEEDHKKKGLVFSTVIREGVLKINYIEHIIYDLESEDVVSVNDPQVNWDSSLVISELSSIQQNNLRKVIPIFHALSKRTVAITGKARSGKDSLGAAIAEESKVDYYTALGEPIKKIDETIYGKTERKRRENLVMLGQGLRGLDPNIWIKSLVKRVVDEVPNYKEQFLEDCVFIVPDVRQPNEFSFFKNLGATTVKVTADEEKRLETLVKSDGESALDENLLKDETEQHSTDFETDYTVHNNYDTDFFTLYVDELVDSLKIEGVIK